MTELSDVQRLMEQTYGARDRSRGLPATVAWLAEAMSELAKAVRYRDGCPRCGSVPCECPAG
jgi:hypothetical protein